MKRTSPANAHGPSPQQRRSRESHDRVLAATERLLRSRAGGDFKLADVSREAGVSVGGIYGRFHNREALVRAVQQRTNERMDEEFAAALAGIRAQDLNGEARIRELTSAIAELIRRHGPTIKAVVDASYTDPVVGAEGRKIYARHLEAFKTAALEKREVIAHEDADRALEFCYLTIYEVVATHLGVGRRATAEGQGWVRLVDDLQHQCVSFLTTPRGRSAKVRSARRSPGAAGRRARSA